MQKVEAIIYRINDKNTPEFLICKRPPSWGGFWQFVTGKVDEGESLEDAVRREVEEEIGVTNIKQIKKTDISFSFKNYQNVEAIEHVFLVKLAQDTEIKLNHEFEEYLWLPYKDALKKLDWMNHKLNLERILDKV